MRAWIAVLFVGCGVDPTGMETAATRAAPAAAAAPSEAPDAGTDAGQQPAAVDAGTISDPPCIPGSDPRCS